ncbi:RagB/SusD family nutrient uptake outer membrane protein [Maribacter polysiphoniae]|uniref:RagB/SusD family nutrient uptake outer membrane protein n=1 Tax=Maribacter polysiphoniae TaxID=429344 RepID=UPI0023540CD1|nr:RagB/SusD family nutrient uptake outer membrane protein [Maribacter polysiphoniae]
MDYQTLKLRLIGFSTYSILLMLISCSEDFLDIVAEDRIDKTSFYESDKELVNAINGVYAKQRIVFNHYGTYYLQDSRSDNAALNQQDQPERVQSDVFQELTNNQEMLISWSQLYDVINHANAIIANTKNVEGDQELVNRIVGEAKFLRAYTYFQIVTTWGDVPLRLLPSEDFDNVTVPTSSSSEVYNQIRIDLNEAISVLPENYIGGKGFEIGRVTKYAALTLLGKLELQIGNNEAAETALRQVIGRYRLLSDYADIYAAGNNNTAESIFEISFEPAGNTGFFLPNYFIPIDETQRLGIPAGGNADQILQFYPTQSLIDEFEINDLRADATFGIAVADNDPYVSKFKDLGAASQGHDVNIAVLRYADVLLSLSEAIGESSEGYELINQVRRRGFGFDPEMVNESVDINFTTPGSFNDKLLHERRVEFAFEHQRWSDLKRLLNPEEVVQLMKEQLFQQEGKDFEISTTDLLFPIPLLEIQISDGAVTQNPGY